MKQELIFEKDEQSFAAPIKIQNNFEVDDNFEVPDMFANLELPKGRFFWGYANIATPDSQGDKFTLDALTSISRGLTIAPYNKIFLFHNYQDIAIGQIVYAMVDGFGLLILAKLNEAHERANEVMASIQNGSLDGFSMAGNMIRVVSQYDEQSGQFVNVVLEATAKEVTLTSIPAHPGASVMGTFRKSMEQFQNRFMKAFKDGEEYQKASMETQSVILSKDKFKTKEDAKKWAEQHDFKVTKIDETETSFRFRQEDPGKFDEESYRTKKIDDGVSLVLGKKKSEKYKKDENHDKSMVEETKKEDVVESPETNSEKVEETPEVTETKETVEEKKEETQTEPEKKEEETKEEGKEIPEVNADSEKDKEIVDLKAKVSELEKEKAELIAKLGAYEKAEKLGYEKAMKQVEEDKQKPFRKSVKSPEGELNKQNSNSTPMLNWLKNN